MCIINIDGSAVNYTEGMTYIDAIRAANPEHADSALAVRVAGIIRGLDEKIQPGADAVTLDFTNEEGRRVYERSLRFVFLLAMHQMYPGKRVRFENSMGGGVYITLPDDVFLSTPAVSRIQARMRELISADMPFTRMEVSQAEALDYFDDCGWDDKVELLRYRAEENFCLYECGGLKEYFYGVMAPSTGYVRTFALHFCMPGIMLMLPDKADCTRPRPFIEQPKLARVLAETARWNEILGCSNVADLNRMTIDRSLREFIRVNEALQARAIADIADRFVESGARVMLIAGPSSSGKTTFTHRMAIELRVLGLKPLLISLDDYYLSRDEMTPRADGTYDLEALEALDVRLFNEQLVSLLQGQSVHLSRFDFTKKRRSLSDTATQLMPGQPIIIEGIHGLNDALTPDITNGAKFRVYISALTQLNLDDHNRIRTTDARLIRRMVRDYQFRASPVDRTFDMWPDVVRGEEKNIFRFQEHADVMFNSSLMYELAILKGYAVPLLSAVSPDSPHYTKARRLLDFLSYFVEAHVEDEVPVNSILREFIGGCCFYRDKD